MMLISYHSCVLWLLLLLPLMDISLAKCCNSRDLIIQHGEILLQGKLSERKFEATSGNSPRF
jgi:hypothetical protein